MLELRAEAKVRADGGSFECWGKNKGCFEQVIGTK
jgi:hypothetical protein